MKLTYHLKVWESKEDDCFYVDIPDYYDCLTYADTKDEALKMGKEALEGHLKSCIETKATLPHFAAEETTVQKDTYPITLDEKLSFVIWLRLEREKNGWTQKQLADKMGISPQNYQRIESIKRFNPNFSTLIKVREALGLRELIV